MAASCRRAGEATAQRERELGHAPWARIPGPPSARSVLRPETRPRGTAEMRATCRVSGEEPEAPASEPEALAPQSVRLAAAAPADLDLGAPREGGGGGGGGNFWGFPERGPSPPRPATVRAA